MAVAVAVAAGVAVAVAVVAVLVITPSQCQWISNKTGMMYDGANIAGVD